MHNTQGRVRRSVAVAASSALVAGTAVAMTAGTTVSADAARVSKDFTYACKAPTGSYQIPVNAKLRLPKKAAAGERLHKRPIRLRMAMPDALRDAVTGAPVDAVAAKGRSNDAALDLKVGKRHTSVPIKRLKAAKAPIPTEKPWVVAAKGRVKGFKVPANAAGGSKAKLRMPKAFSVRTVLYDAEGNRTRATLDCAVDGKRKLATIKVKRAPSTLRTNVNPDRIVAKKTRAKVHVNVKTTGKATGLVTVKDRKDVIGADRVEAGMAHVRLDKFAHPGKHRLTIKYSGNKSVKPSKVREQVRVVKR